MKNRLVLLVVLCAAGLIAVVVHARSQARPSAHVEIPIIAARPEDVGSIEAIVRADYESISGGVGVARQWGRDHTLYDPHARFVGMGTDPKTGATIKQSFSEQEYADQTDAGSVKNGFTERELGHSIHRYGNVATILSSYETKLASTGKIASRGVNIYQMYFDGKRWWILSIVWDDEGPGNPIPPELLPKQ